MIALGHPDGLGVGDCMGREPTSTTAGQWIGATAVRSEDRPERT